MTWRKSLRPKTERLKTVLTPFLSHEPGMELVRRQLLQDALRFYESFLKEKGNDSGVREETAHTYCYLGDLEKRLGQQAAAEKAYGAASAFYQQLVTEFPQQLAYRFKLAGCYTNLANAFVSGSREKRAEERGTADSTSEAAQRIPTNKLDERVHLLQARDKRQGARRESERRPEWSTPRSPLAPFWRSLSLDYRQLRRPQTPRQSEMEEPPRWAVVMLSSVGSLR